MAVVAISETAWLLPKNLGPVGLGLPSYSFCRGTPPFFALGEPVRTDTSESGPSTSKATQLFIYLPIYLALCSHVFTVFVY